MLTTISGYRVIDGCRGPASTYAQQRAMLLKVNRDPNPWKAFLDDLTSFIQHQQEKGCDILLCLDANESTQRSKSGIGRLAATCSLLDIHALRFPDQHVPSHSNGSEKIDYVFCSQNVADAVV